MSKAAFLHLLAAEAVDGGRKWDLGSGLGFFLASSADCMDGRMDGLIWGGVELDCVSGGWVACWVIEVGGEMSDVEGVGGR